MVKLIVSYAEKGGVGKSTMLSGLIDNIIANGTPAKSLGLLDADKNQDMSIRFNGLIDTKCTLLEEADDRDRFYGAGRIIEAAEEMKKDKSIIFLNLPAAASTTLSTYIEDFKGALDDIDISLTTLFVADDTPKSAEIYNESLESGIISQSDNCLVIKNLKNGGAGEWPIDDALIDLVFSINELDTQIKEIISETLAPFSVLADDGDLFNTFSARRLKKWIGSFDAIREAILKPS